MKVMLLNGSPHFSGCTNRALEEVAQALNAEGIDTEIFHVGNDAIKGCCGCGMCRSVGKGKCIFTNDTVNTFLKKMETADGLVVGSPVHYAAASGDITSFLDRVFYASGGFPDKPGASIVSCRRAGSTAALEQLNKYFTISNMPVVSSGYWNMVHGNSPEEVEQDLEGMSIMRNLGRNMAWLLKCIEAGKKSGFAVPNREPKAKTNFIR